MATAKKKASPKPTGKKAAPAKKAAAAKKSPTAKKAAAPAPKAPTAKKAASAKPAVKKTAAAKKAAPSKTASPKKAVKAVKAVAKAPAAKKATLAKTAAKPAAKPAVTKAPPKKAAEVKKPVKKSVAAAVKKVLKVAAAKKEAARKQAAAAKVVKKTVDTKKATKPATTKVAKQVTAKKTAEKRMEKKSSPKAPKAEPTATGKTQQPEAKKKTKAELLIPDLDRPTGMYDGILLCDDVKPFPSKTPYSVKELEKLREALLEERSRLVSELSSLAGMSRDALEMTNENPGYSVHMAEHATDLQTAEANLGVRSIEQERLELVDAALERIEKSVNHYGLCLACGSKIGIQRLIARPHAHLCMDCRQRYERIKAKRG